MRALRRIVLERNHIHTLIQNTSQDDDGVDDARARLVGTCKHAYPSRFTPPYRANDARRSNHQSYFHYVDSSCSTLTSWPVGHCYYSEMRDAFRARERTNVSRVTHSVCAEIPAYQSRYR